MQTQINSCAAPQKAETWENKHNTRSCQLMCSWCTRFVRQVRVRVLSQNAKCDPRRKSTHKVAIKVAMTLNTYFALVMCFDTGEQKMQTQIKFLVSAAHQKAETWEN